MNEEQKAELITELETSVSQLVRDHIDLTYLDYDDLEESLQTAITQTEIISYYPACRYLLDNDPSLKDSIEMLVDLSYSDLSNISSELLATVHLQAELMNETSGIAQIVETFTEDLENE